jgi:ABC-type dipeptide/oligopeptide/nickel transport system permease subunit
MTLQTAPTSKLDSEALSLDSVSLWQITRRRLFRRKSSIVGMIILAIMIFIALTAQWLAPYEPTRGMLDTKDYPKEYAKKRLDPCIHIFGCSPEEPQHIMGLDGNMRDEFSRLLYGARLSLLIGLSTVSFAIVIGTVLGALGGYFGGWIDNVIMRMMDVLLAFPSLLLAIAIVTVLGPGLINALIAIGIVSIPAYARVVRGSVLSVREMDYVSATRALGGNTYEILFKRILPNALTPLIVQGTLGIATAILDAAALSFLGLGAQPPTPEWGSMLGAERNQVFTAPHLVFYPGFMIMITVLAFNLLGDGLRDALDPRLAHVS